MVSFQINIFSLSIPIPYHWTELISAVWIKLKLPIIEFWSSFVLFFYTRALPIGKTKGGQTRNISALDSTGTEALCSTKSCCLGGGPHTLLDLHCETLPCQVTAFSATYLSVTEHISKIFMSPVCCIRSSAGCIPGPCVMCASIAWAVTEHIPTLTPEAPGQSAEGLHFSIVLLRRNGKAGPVTYK